MKYSRGIARNVEKYFNKYFCKYKSKTRFNRFEYSAIKRMVYSEWYFDHDDTFEEYTCKREYFNYWVDRSRLNLALMGYIEGSKMSTGEKLFTGFKPNHAIAINLVHNNNQSYIVIGEVPAIKQLPILYKGGK